MGTAGNLISQLGGAVGSLFQSQGNVAEANSYTSAAQLDEQNAQLTAASTRIQAYQEARTVTQSIGTTQADVAGAGFTESGSALDILKSSAQQGALATSLINIQGAINENAYAAEAGANYAKAKAANEANTAGTISAIASIGGALVNGGQQLASAGQTVAKGYNYLFGGASAIDASAPDAAAAQLTGQTLSDVQNGGTALGNDSSLLNIINGGSSSAVASATDTSIDEGASLFTGDVVNDTSGLALGTSEAVASDAISQAAGDVIPGVGEVLLAAQLAQAVGIGGTVGSIANDISSGVDTVVNGVVSAVSDVGSAIGSVFSSVICTALYKRGKISRPVWNAAQRYGRDIASRPMYNAYLLWGRPIARAIDRHEWFVPVASFFFTPWAHELAVHAGERRAVSTWRGRSVYAITYAFTWVFGHLLEKGKKYVATGA